MTTVKIILEGKTYYFEFEKVPTVEELQKVMEILGGRPRRD